MTYYAKKIRSFWFMEGLVLAYKKESMVSRRRE